MDGNTTSTLSYFRYTDDAGGNFSVKTADQLALPMGGVPTAAHPELPKSLRPRRVHMQAVVDGIVKHKSVVAFTGDHATIAAGVSTTVNIDGVDFTTTGYTGEKRTFPSI